MGENKKQKLEAKNDEVVQRIGEVMSLGPGKQSVPLMQLADMGVGSEEEDSSFSLFSCGPLIFNFH